MRKDYSSKVESFVWNDQSSDDSDGDDKHTTMNSSSSWRIDSIRSSRIFDSDPHSLTQPNSHVAWKNELKLTRFANQELPEALWGSNSLVLTHLGTGVRISFCAFEGLRIWSLMDGHDDALTIIPHLSGRIPDPWDYTYTTNYSGSVERTTGIATVAAKQPDGRFLYATKINNGSFLTQKRTQAMPSMTTVGPSPIMPIIELRPPMCKCVGGRMICGGIAKSLTTKLPSSMKGLNSSPRQLPQLSPTPKPKSAPKWIPCDDEDGIFDMEGLLNSQRSPPLYYTKQIPFWAQNLDPQSYSFLTVSALVCNGVNNIKYNNNKENDNSMGGFIAILMRCFVRVNGVRVRLVDTKFIIRRRKIKRRRRQNKQRHNVDNGIDDNDVDKGYDVETPMVVLREKSWKEGTWNEYLTGKKNSCNQNNDDADADADVDADETKMIDLGTDLEQGRRASRNLPHKFPPIVEKIVLYDDDEIDGFDDKDDHSYNELPTTIKPRTTTTTTRNQRPVTSPAVVAARTITIEEWVPRISWTTSSDGEKRDGIITSCSVGSGIVLLVIDSNKLVALNYQSGAFLWERNQISFECCSSNSPSLLSVAVQKFSPLLKDKIENNDDDDDDVKRQQQRIVVGDDRGGVHIFPCFPTKGDPQSFFFSNSVDASQSHKHTNDNNSSIINRGKMQNASCWVEKVTWSENGRYFAAAAGRNVMINGEILEMESSVYDLIFLTSNNTKKDTHQLLAVAIYGGLTIINVDTMTISNRRFTVGSSAVLSCAISKDGRLIGIGCLDKRIRIFKKLPSNDGDDSNDDDDDEDQCNGHWLTRDWIGFDGGVSCISYSKDNERLAAIGGNILLVIERNLKLGEAPVICTCWPPFTSKQNSGRFKSLVWSTNNVLVASTEQFLHFFDVLDVVDTIPKQCYPMKSIPIFEKSYFIIDGEGVILVWGQSKIRKIKVS